jgi:hypothetical protein
LFTDDAPYTGAREHFLDELQRVQRWLLRHRLLFPDRYGEDSDPSGEQQAQLNAELDELSQRILCRERNSLQSGIRLPLLRLKDALGLRQHELDLLIAIAAAETEPEFYRAYLRIFGDNGGRQGDVAFYAELVGGRGEERYAVESALQPSGILARHGLIVLSSDRAWLPRPPPLYMKIKLGNRVAPYLQGEALPLPGTLPHGLGIYLAERSREELILPQGLDAKVAEALEAAQNFALGSAEDFGGFDAADEAKDDDGHDAKDDAARSRSYDPVCLLGPRHSGRKALVAALLPEAPLVVLHADSLPKAEDALVELVREALCEAALQGNALYIDHIEALLNEAEAALFSRLCALLRQADLRIVLSCDGNVDKLVELLPRLIRVDLPMPDTATQAALWSSLLPTDVPLDPTFDLATLTMNYSLPAGSIHRCIEQLVRAARMDKTATSPLSMKAARDAVRKQLGNRFGDLAQLVENTFAWSDLVLPADVLERVFEVVAYAKHREQLLGAWGFARKLPYGRSMSVLLAGPPGTGKTMVSSLIAKEIGLELFRINVSRAVDKYIGETEKNLARIFDEARRGQVALLFDEADSLFSKRTEVKSSTDRYSNLAINFLLQAVESHDGMIILTTNNEKAMDEAFRRRLRFRISFPFPAENERARLWESMLPKEAVAEPDIDWSALARRYQISGGSIKNAVVRAALRALINGSSISMDLLRIGARLECEEMGYLVMDDEQELTAD